MSSNLTDARAAGQTGGTGKRPYPAPHPSGRPHLGVFDPDGGPPDDPPADPPGRRPDRGFATMYHDETSDPDISPSAFRALAVLRGFSRKRGRCRPSNAEIAAKVPGRYGGPMDPGHVGRLLIELEDAGRILRRFGKPIRTNPTGRVILILDELPALTEETGFLPGLEGVEPPRRRGGGGRAGAEGGGRAGADSPCCFSGRNQRP